MPPTRGSTPANPGTATAAAAATQQELDEAQAAILGMFVSTPPPQLPPRSGSPHVSIAGTLQGSFTNMVAANSSFITAVVKTYYDQAQVDPVTIAATLKRITDSLKAAPKPGDKPKGGQHVMFLKCFENTVQLCHSVTIPDSTAAAGTAYEGKYIFFTKDRDKLDQACEFGHGDPTDIFGVQQLKVASYAKALSTKNPASSTALIQPAANTKAKPTLLFLPIVGRQWCRLVYQGLYGNTSPWTPAQLVQELDPYIKEISDNATATAAKYALMSMVTDTSSKPNASGTTVVGNSDRGFDQTEPDILIQWVAEHLTHVLDCDSSRVTHGRNNAGGSTHGPAHAGGFTPGGSTAGGSTPGTSGSTAGGSTPGPPALPPEGPHLDLALPPAGPHPDLALPPPGSHPAGSTAAGSHTRNLRLYRRRVHTRTSGSTAAGLTPGRLYRRRVHTWNLRLYRRRVHTWTQ